MSDERPVTGLEKPQASWRERGVGAGLRQGRRAGPGPRRPRRPSAELGRLGDSALKPVVVSRWSSTACRLTARSRVNVLACGMGALNIDGCQLMASAAAFGNATES